MINRIVTRISSSWQVGRSVGPASSRAGWVTDDQQVLDICGPCAP